MRVIVFLGLFVLGTLLGCNKITDKKSQFSLDGDRYELTNGYLVDGMIWLFGNGLSITGLNPDNGDPIFSGTGDMFGIAEIENQEGITAGTYSFSEVEAGVATNYNPSNETYDYHQYLNDGTGTCTIKITGLEYEIECDGTLGDGKEFETYFKGILVQISK